MKALDVAEGVFWCTAIAVAAVAAHAWYTPKPLQPLPPRFTVVAEISADGTLLRTPGYGLTTEIAAYQDELFAYLMFQHLRRYPPVASSGGRLLLTFDPKQKQAPYRVVLEGEADLVTAIGAVAPLDNGWKLTPDSVRRSWEEQTRIFENAYNLPVRQKLEDLPREALGRYLQRFIEFKSRTDPRIRLKMEPVPVPVSEEQAQRLAGDMLTVAAFYDLPLEILVGVGAIENNYMDVRGDLQHSIWKRRAEPGDIVLERRRGRVRVANFSTGVWQVTRQTLRYAHGLVAKDGRDYTQLPEELRPPEKFDIDAVSPRVLTTYAGMLLRDLLDQFEGDVMLAVSAYNGGPKRPNLRYGEGVQRAAEHARRVVEQAAVLNGEAVVQRSWLR
ncbi:MAG: hypothetical protein JNK87_21635 [Bryobacterales bacterium]|nr:hypothetical protein [Bryobacterales bacterium]